MTRCPLCSGELDYLGGEPTCLHCTMDYGAFAVSVALCPFCAPDELCALHLSMKPEQYEPGIGMPYHDTHAEKAGQR